MSPIRTASAVAVALLVCAAPARAFPPLTSAVHRHHHHHHLLTAANEMRAAEAAVAANNAPAAYKLVAAAIGNIEAAMHHHHHYYTTAPRTGLFGNVGFGVHHHHHSHLQRAVADLRAAEKQLRAGHASKAVQDIEKGGHQLYTAVALHHSLINR